METQNKEKNNSTTLSVEPIGKTVNKNLFNTIHGDTNDRHIKIPVDDYEDLGIIKADLIEALNIINHSKNWMPSDTSITGASDSIIRLLKSMSIIEELSGLDKFLKIT
ncbi:hypothetical protein [Winogradskyella sediminis]|uniref:hypothetical protein n=1 Tax=Winogradskyella sediminis TaxID=1382466 RepID=UPI000E24574E|nr:hypothetical protein [Winogradskyella sediminis]REG89902.1 hypothetical protein C8N41_1011148 [Winogradskyella sediminis]